MKRYTPSTCALFRVEGRRLGDRPVAVQVMSCTCTGCTAVFEKTLKQSAPLPLQVLAKFAARKGWQVRANRAEVLCPNHT